jgi:hypothetical protein
MKADMNHPLRTLLNEVFVAPPKRLYLNVFEMAIRTIRLAIRKFLRIRRHWRLPQPQAVIEVPPGKAAIVPVFNSDSSKRARDSAAK